ncbi:MAG: hypothetical protein ACPGUV_10100 [Polyangiales bacterium]
MDALTTRLRQWNVGLAQAERFGAKDNFSDAVARLQSLETQMRHALEGSVDGRARSRIDALHTTCKARLTHWQAQAGAQRARLEARLAAQIAAAGTEAQKPLPTFE